MASITSRHLLAYQIEATSPLISGQWPRYSNLLKFGGHFGLCKLGGVSYWDSLGLLVWCSGDFIETHYGKKNSVTICSKFSEKSG